MEPRELLERVMDRLEEAYDRGEITPEDYKAEIRELRAEYRDAAADAAQDEYARWFKP